MKRGTKTIIWGAAAVVFTAVVKFVDVQTANSGKSVGLATINKAIFGFIGASEVWANIVSVLLGIAIAAAIVAIGWAAARWAKDGKDSKKVGRKLGWFIAAIAAMIAVYLVFAKLIMINYGPVVGAGVAEITFPATQALIAVVLCMISAIVLSSLCKKRVIRIIINTALPTLMVWIIVGVVMAGTSWATDAIGALLYGMTIVSLYQTLIERK